MTDERYIVGKRINIYNVLRVGPWEIVSIHNDIATSVFIFRSCSGDQNFKFPCGL